MAHGAEVSEVYPLDVRSGASMSSPSMSGLLSSLSTPDSGAPRPRPAVAGSAMLGDAQDAALGPTSYPAKPLTG